MKHTERQSVVTNKYFMKTKSSNRLCVMKYTIGLSQSQSVNIFQNPDFNPVIFARNYPLGGTGEIEKAW